MSDTKARRSRLHRTRTGKRVELTRRDIEIFRLLGQYRYLRSTYIHAFVGGASETRFKERLGDLFHEGFLDRPARQWEFADARCQPAVHELGDRGRRVLAEHGCHAERTYLGVSAHRQFLHALMICECLASIELAARAHAHLRFIPWAEIQGKMPEAARHSGAPFKMMVGGSALIPDALFGLEYRTGERKAYRFFALEADRGTMPVSRSAGGQTSYLAKLASYREAIAQGLSRTHWGLPNLFVLTVTNGRDRLADMLRKLEGEHPVFLFKAVEGGTLRCPLQTLLNEPWERARLTPFPIET
jgi:hypothetical protein